jgi:hypothetical protein
MFRSLLISVLFLCAAFHSSVFATNPIPTPDHVVVLVLENHGYSQVVGSSSAPYLNGLMSDAHCALLTQSYALSHPSQPNYIQLFSGSNQGVVDDNVPAVLPFTTLNLGAALLSASKTLYGSHFRKLCAQTQSLGKLARHFNKWISNNSESTTHGIPNKFCIASNGFVCHAESKQ